MDLIKSLGFFYVIGEPDWLETSLETTQPTAQKCCTSSYFLIRCTYRPIFPLLINSTLKLCCNYVLFVQRFLTVLAF